MVIDDECDQASVDTKKDEEQLSAINKTIRKLLIYLKEKFILDTQQLHMQMLLSII